MWMPGTRVAIGLKGPPLAWPGLRSKVSSCDGPPLIHRRMQDFFGRAGKAAAADARLANQPETPEPRAPAADSFSQSRRDKRFVDMECLQMTVRSMIERELRAVEQRPEDVRERFLRAAGRPALVDVLDAPRAFGGCRLAR